MCVLRIDKSSILVFMTLGKIHRSAGNQVSIGDQSTWTDSTILTHRHTQEKERRASRRNHGLPEERTLTLEVAFNKATEEQLRRSDIDCNLAAAAD